MVNKKVILGILTIGMLATVAGAGTWAYLTSTTPDLSASGTAGTITLSNAGGAAWTFASTDPAFDNIILPGESSTATVTFSNTGNSKGYLYITPTFSTASDITLTFKVDGVEKTFTSGQPFNVGELAAGSGNHIISVTAAKDASSIDNTAGTFTVGLTATLNQIDTATGQPATTEE